MTNEAAANDAWSAGQSYDHYMGRWSRLIAAKFLDWLKPPAGADWMDVGCGTGALSAAILETANPKSVIGIDPSDGFVEHARTSIDDQRARFEVGNAQSLNAPDRSMDVVTSALALNFVPDMPAALREMQRVVRRGGLVSFYVWDYPGGGMGFIDAFWRAAAELDPAAAELDEAKRFPFCTLKGLKERCQAAGLNQIDLAPVEIATSFATFEDFWHPFTLGAGPAPGYCMNLQQDRRDALKSCLRQMIGGQEPVSLPARAWAMKAAA